MKTTSLVLLALALPASLAGCAARSAPPAQQPSGPPANPITTVFRGRTMALQRNLAQAFDSIPERLYSYKPTPAQLSVGYIAQHLANDNYIFCDAFGDMKGTRAEEETTTADSVKATWPKEKLMAQLRASFTFCENAFAQLDDAKLADQVTMTFRGQSRQVTRAGMVLGHVVDMADHYSQIANYMRLNNMLPPTALPRPNQ
ncbi:MAG TPA: DinB family protein [Longimicrobium sp.]